MNYKKGNPNGKAFIPVMACDPSVSTTKVFIVQHKGESHLEVQDKNKEESHQTYGIILDKLTATNI